MSHGDSGTDRNGIGMLYACAAGIIVGTTVSHGTDPANGLLLGFLTMAAALYHHVDQRYVSTDLDGSTESRDDG